MQNGSLINFDAFLMQHITALVRYGAIEAKYTGLLEEILDDKIYITDVVIHTLNGIVVLIPEIYLPSRIIVSVQAEQEKTNEH